ncbi:MAG TPA: hypothetical protein VF546_19580 [Pyrinomonadaceae bacterium]|jgi:hypothetical protein
MRQVTQIHAATAARPIRLRELGVYKLPDGREFIVSTIYSDGCCSLYQRHAWDTFGNAEFWVGPDGRLFRRGAPTSWRVQDLVDTGQTSRYPKARRLL